MNDDLELIREEVARKTSVPAPLLTGTTAAEIFEQAGSLLKLRYLDDSKRPAREQFRDWLDPEARVQEYESKMKSLRELACPSQVQGHPTISDCGESAVTRCCGPYDGYTPQEQFALFVDSKLAFDPWKDKDGWRPLF